MDKSNRIIIDFFCFLDNNSISDGILQKKELFVTLKIPVRETRKPRSGGVVVKKAGESFEVRIAPSPERELREIGFGEIAQIAHRGTIPFTVFCPKPLGKEERIAFKEGVLSVMSEIGVRNFPVFFGSPASTVKDPIFACPSKTGGIKFFA